MTKYPTYQIVRDALAAKERVQNTPELAKHYSVICEYDWPNMTDHIAWVLSAPVSEIVDWAESIESYTEEVEE